jgi:hypothetical protein
LPYARASVAKLGGVALIEIEVQNETHQTQTRLKFTAVPRMGEGIRLQEPDGFWVSYDIIDVWYQKADFGDVWVPYIHVRATASEQLGSPKKSSKTSSEDQQKIVDTAKKVAGILKAREAETAEADA